MGLMLFELQGEEERKGNEVKVEGGGVKKM